MSIIFILIIALLVIIDQIIKVVVSHNIMINESIPVIKFGNKEIFNLTHILNDGAGWSIFSGKTLFLIIITSVFLLAAIVYLIKFSKRNFMLTTSLILIISGGFGNLFDRIFRGGKVIDYVQTLFMNFTIFNFADICVVIGAILLIVFVAFFDRTEASTKTLNKTVHEDE